MSATVNTILHSFPTFEPLRFAPWNRSLLGLPLRRDILHRAVVYEADADRQGTASTKTRAEVNYSGRKLRPQKGTGQARLGDRGSPMLKGGGVAHGPKPRDFSTELPRKIYALAVRTALSARYARGELVVVRGHMELPLHKTRVLVEVLEGQKWSHANGGALLVVNCMRERLAIAARNIGHYCKVVQRDQVDVRDLLKWGQVVIERRALEWLEEQTRIERTRV